MASIAETLNRETLANQAQTRIGHLALLEMQHLPDTKRRTSIICTIGPSSGGQNGPKVAVALDTKGPEIRTGMNQNGEDIPLVKGKTIRLGTNKCDYDKGTEKFIYCDYVNLPKVATTDSCIFIDDGLIELKVIAVGADWVDCEIQNNGMLGSRKGCNLPGANVDLPALSEKDKLDLQFGVERGVDIVFASFIRKASDIDDVRTFLGDGGKNIKVIAKIENHEGVCNFNDILHKADGIMVARGDLGIEVPPEKVFLAQKMIIAKCNMAGKPVICATQMLESMTYNPRPTRAEVSDVANAVLDGVDCVMLSGETAKGKYPIEAVNMMNKACLEAESAFNYRIMFDELSQTSIKYKPNITSDTVAHAAVQASFDQHLAAIVVLSTSGTTAQLISKYRPRCPIIMITRNASVAKQAHLCRGVYPLLYTAEQVASFQDDVDLRLQWGLKVARKNGYLKIGDEVICIQGWRCGVGHTNTLRVIEVK